MMVRAMDKPIPPRSALSRKMVQACPRADADDFAQAFRFQIAQDSDLISPTVPI
jgi:hypothetical protein